MDPTDRSCRSTVQQGRERIKRRSARSTSAWSSAESHHIVIQRHLAAARPRLRARDKGQLSVGPQTEIPVPKHGGDLAEKLEAAEDERQAVADEAAPDLD